MKHHGHMLLATGLGLGYLRGPTGTYGAALGLAFFLLLSLYTPAWLPALLAIPGFFLCVASAGHAAKNLGNEDPKQVVCDEICGQWITLLFFPLHWQFLLAGFLAFRFFDIVKPFPARRFEHLPGGWGIVMDDLMAAVYAHLLLWILYHFHVLHSRVGALIP